MTSLNSDFLIPISGLDTDGYDYWMEHERPNGDIIMTSKFSEVGLPMTLDEWIAAMLPLIKESSPDAVSIKLKRAQRRPPVETVRELSFPEEEDQ